MKPHPTTSVALATYNGARFLAEQLESLAQQTCFPNELVICDDASTDATMDIVAAFAARAPFPVRFEVNEARLGYRANFMKAANLCRSDILAFCDQDDIWLPRKIEASLAFFENKNVLLTYHNASVVSEELGLLGSLEDRRPPNPLNSPGSIEPWQYGLGFTLSFRRCLLAYSSYWSQSADFYNPSEPEAHDQWFFFLASALGSIGYMAEPLVLYRQHGKNTCGWHSNRANGLWHRFRKASYTDVETFTARAQAAEKRAFILDALTATADKRLRPSASRIADVYRALAVCYRLRQELYETRNISAKLVRLAALLKEGRYRSRAAGGVGYKALIRDILRGIVFSPQAVRLRNQA